MAPWRPLSRILEIIQCWPNLSPIFFQVKFSMYFLIFGIDKNNIIIIVDAGVSFDPGIISDKVSQPNHLKVRADE